MYNDIYLGIVDDNNDPDRDSKCRIRVINIFDGLPTEDIPWATPFKDLNGIACSLPDKGKVVGVHFENGDIYNPIYRYSEHYNVNLKQKLDSITEEDYTSMKALIFDHKTQIFVNDSEGLNIDHKFNKINIAKDSINLELKDNYGSINIGTKDADQQAILGNNLLDWFDVFVDELLGISGGPFLGNLGAPVITHPSLIKHLVKYRANRDTKFLSHNVNLNDNGYIDKLDRVNINTTGDEWKSINEDNNISTLNKITDYEPLDGTKGTTPNGDLTSSDIVDGNFDEISMPINGSENQDVLILIKVLKDKEYEIYTEKFKMNIVGVRTQRSGDVYSNKFNDKLYAFYRDESDNWKIKRFKISTLPGTKIKITENRFNKLKVKTGKGIIGETISLKRYAQLMGRKGLSILKTAQYINSFYLGIFPSNTRALKSNGKQLVYRDSNWDSDTITYSSEEEGNFGIHIHRGYLGGVDVNNWSEACQVFSSEAGLDGFMDLMEVHKDIHGNKFTYTLIGLIDYESAETYVDELTEQDRRDLRKP